MKKIKYLNNTPIDWCDYTWNPVVGCQNNCWYCYARKINNRFHFIKNWNEPQFFPERLNVKFPSHLPMNRNRIAQQISPNKPLIFVCSMGDLFGDNIPDKWINDIIDVVKNNPQCNFAFLTKCPQNTAKWKFPINSILGLTIASKNKIHKSFLPSFLSTLISYENEVKFYLSIEPIMTDFEGIDFSMCDFIIVGAMTKMGKRNIIPQPEWIQSINHPRVYLKDNILKIINRS